MTTASRTGSRRRAFGQILPRDPLEPARGQRDAHRRLPAGYDERQAAAGPGGPLASPMSSDEFAHAFDRWLVDLVSWLELPGRA
jgi:hypothetical protein